MPIFTPTGMKAVIQYSLGTGVIAQNVLHYQGAGGFTTADLADLAADIAALVGDATFRSYIHSSVAIQGVTVYDLESTPAAPAFQSVALAGTHGSNAMPGNVTVAIKLLTGAAGRSYRGRLFQVGLAEDQITADSLAAGVGAALCSVWDTFRTFTYTNPSTWAVLSQFTGNAPRATGVLTPIVSLACDNVTDSQRRRLLGRGR